MGRIVVNAQEGFFHIFFAVLMKIFMILKYNFCERILFCNMFVFLFGNLMLLAFWNCNPPVSILRPESESWHDALLWQLLVICVTRASFGYKGNLFPEKMKIGKWKPLPEVGKKNQYILTIFYIKLKVPGGNSVSTYWNLNPVMYFLPASRKETAYQSFADRQSYVAAWGNTFT